MNRNSKTISFSIFLVVLIVAVLILAGSKNSLTGKVTAIQNSDNKMTLDDAIKNKDMLIAEYNKYANKMPYFIRTIFGNEIIELNVKRTIGNYYNTLIVTEKGFVVDNPKEDTTECTLNVEMNQATFESVLNSENQVNAFTEAIKNDKIEYNAGTFGTKVKTGIAGAILTVISWF